MKYPDIAAAIPGLVKPGIKSVVLDCEAVAFERETGKILPFQVPCLRLPNLPSICPHLWDASVLDLAQRCCLEKAFSLASSNGHANP